MLNKMEQNLIEQTRILHDEIVALAERLDRLAFIQDTLLNWTEYVCENCGQRCKKNMTKIEQSLDEQIRILRNEITILSNRITSIEALQRKHASSAPSATIWTAYLCEKCGKGFSSTIANLREKICFDCEFIKKEAK